MLLVEVEVRGLLEAAAMAHPILEMLVKAITSATEELVAPALLLSNGGSNNGSLCRIG